MHSVRSSGLFIITKARTQFSLLHVWNGHRHCNVAMLWKFKADDVSCLPRHRSSLIPVLNEGGRVPKATCCLVPFIEHSRKGKTIEMRNSLFLGVRDECRGWLKRDTDPVYVFPLGFLCIPVNLPKLTQLMWPREKIQNPASLKMMF